MTLAAGPWCPEAGISLTVSGRILELLAEDSRAALGLLVCRAVVWGALGLLPVC